MKLPRNISSARRQAGIMLIECLVYIAVFAILLGIGTAAFFFCWDHSKAVILATDQITSALHAGERWRADVRAATGKISIEMTAAGETVRIPEPGKEIVYRFESGAMRREIPALKTTWLMLPKVKSSQMTTEVRGGATVWRWELELAVPRHETQVPLSFTFDSVQARP